MPDGTAMPGPQWSCPASNGRARPAMVELATELGVTCAAFTCDGDVATLADQVWDVRSTVQPLRVGLWAPVRAPFGAVFASWSSDSAIEQWLSDIDERIVPRYRAAVAAIRARGYVVELRTPSRDSGPALYCARRGTLCCRTFSASPANPWCQCPWN